MSAPALTSKANIDKLRNGWFSEVNDQWPGTNNTSKRDGEPEPTALRCADECGAGRCGCDAHSLDFVCFLLRFDFVSITYGCAGIALSLQCEEILLEVQSEYQVNIHTDAQARAPAPWLPVSAAPPHACDSVVLFLSSSAV